MYMIKINNNTIARADQADQPLLFVSVYASNFLHCEQCPLREGSE